VVDDFTPQKRNALKATFATEADVPVHQVTVDVVSASVRVTVSIAVASEVRSSALVTSLGTKLTDAQAATDFLGGDVKVETTPALRAVDTTQAQRPQGGMPDGLLYGVIGGGVGALLILLIAMACLLRRRSKRREAYSRQGPLPNVLVKPQPSRDVATKLPRLVEVSSTSAALSRADAPSPPKSAIEIMPTSRAAPDDTEPVPSRAAASVPSRAAPRREAPKLPPSHRPELRTHLSL